jgi:hypothetical protein
MQVLTNLEVSNVSGAGVNTGKLLQNGIKLAKTGADIKDFFDSLGTYLSTPIKDQPGYEPTTNGWEGNDGTNGGSGNSGWEGNGS